MGQMPPAQWAWHCDGGVAQLTPAACSCCVQSTQPPSGQPAALGTTRRRVASHRTWYVPHTGLGTGVGPAGANGAGSIMALMDRGRRLTTAEPDALPAIAAMKMTSGQDDRDPALPSLRGWVRAAGCSPNRQDGGTAGMTHAQKWTLSIPAEVRAVIPSVHPPFSRADDGEETCERERERKRSEGAHGKVRGSTYIDAQVMRARSACCCRKPREMVARNCMLRA